MKALVLLGSHGSGKDTVANSLIVKYPGSFYNAKFSKLLKEITANAYYTNTKQLENKTWRNTPGMYRVSPLDVLNALFYGSTHVQNLAESILDSCISSIPLDTIPIFTDIRRDKELQKVLEVFGEEEVIIIRLLRSSSTPDDTDNYLNESVINFTHVNNDGAIEQTVEEVINLLELKPTEPEYSIHMYYKPSHLTINPRHKELDFTTYSFDKILRSFQGVFEEPETDLLLELTSEALTTALNLGLKPHINKDNMPTDSYVEFDSNFPMSLLRHLSKKATLVWHVKKAHIEDINHLLEENERVVNNGY
jgi:ribose 1,5-bisphosphokinase PhnN